MMPDEMTKRKLIALLLAEGDLDEIVSFGGERITSVTRVVAPPLRTVVYLNSEEVDRE